MCAELGTFVVNNHNPNPLISISTLGTFNLRTIALSTHFSYSSKVCLPCGISNKD